MSKKKKTVRYLELNLGKSAGSFGRFSSAGTNTELAILRVIKKAAADKKLHGIFVNTSGFPSGDSSHSAYLWELLKALEEFKAAGKKIATYFDNAEMDLYCLLSLSDKIIMDEAGSLSLTGYSRGHPFAKESLAKLGIGFRELRYFEFKSANEIFSRTSFSEANRKQYSAYLDDIFEVSKTAILQNRKIGEETFNKILSQDFLLSPIKARDRSLVDVIGREAEIKQTITMMEFPDLTYPLDDKDDEERVEFVSAGNMHFSFFNPGQKNPDYIEKKARGFLLPEIAIVHAKGASDMERGMKARTVAKTIRKLLKKSRVKALVLRIDSPGGSAVAADFIDAAVREAKKKIPVIVSFGQVAASGGYWAAMNASHICTTPYTLTGSIGVISAWFYDKSLNSKLGLDFDIIKKGDHSDLGAGVILPKRDLTDEEEGRFKANILDLYSTFVKKAAEGRNMKVENLELLARGRVYSGITSKALTLTDSLGGYLDALSIAKDLAKISQSKKIRIREYPKLSFSDKMKAKISPAAFQGIFSEVTDIWEELNFRFDNNGKAMPILPLDFKHERSLY
ncbi:MAG: signal peptide peptidase SppA [Treponema sp.]|nr:signal peptide peptidase SppA [Treponema sp.]